MTKQQQSHQGPPQVAQWESTASAGDTRVSGSVPGLGRYPGGGNGNLLQYSCLENPMDRGAWWATVHGVSELETTQSHQEGPTLGT